MSEINRETLIQTINNIDVDKLKHDIIKVAFDSLNDNKKIDTVFAFLSTKTGELEYKTKDDSNNENYFLLSKYDIKPFHLDYEAEDILDGDSLNEFLSVVEDEESEFFEEPEYALEYILDKYELDKDELVKEHFMKSNLDNVKIFNIDDITDKL